jgi:hypothetical protein
MSDSRTQALHINNSGELNKCMSELITIYTCLCIYLIMYATRKSDEPHNPRGYRLLQERIEATKDH